jgi:2-iminobutanoate/2-iminopropanoate deaminase
MKRVIESPDAPAAAGAYSQATTDGSVVFTAGQIPQMPGGDLLTEEPVPVQTRQCLENVQAVLAEEGVTMEDVLQVTVYLADIETFDAMDGAYREYFLENPPARSTVGGLDLPRGAGVEIEAVATAE